jgi:pimeloyl-ACP methyl ester carboxylesterase
MSWISFTPHLRRFHVAEEPPEALVILLHDLGAAPATMAPVAARWSSAVRKTTFMALGEVDLLDRGCREHRVEVTPAANAGVEPTVLDRASQHLETLVRHQLKLHRLEADQLVLVGFGYGGTLALHLLLRRGFGCAGILAIGAELATPLPRVLRIDCKIRLIDVATDRIDHGRLRHVVARFNSRCIDARGVLLAGPLISDNVVRHGTAYLVELVATAQRGNRFHVERTSAHV